MIILQKYIQRGVKSERIVELSGKLNEFADFENVTDRRSAANLALRTLPVKKFGSCILNELRIVDLRPCRHVDVPCRYVGIFFINMFGMSHFFFLKCLKCQCHSHLSHLLSLLV